MVKVHDPVKLEEEAVAKVIDLLNEVPAARIKDVLHKWSRRDSGVDFQVKFDVGGAPHHLLVDVRSNGAPRVARQAIDHMISALTTGPARDLRVGNLMFVAPYLSPQARSICRESGVNYCDLVGNARVVANGLYIDREVAEAPEAEKRNLRSLFKPKSARVLRYLLKAAGRPHRLTEIAEATAVSLGQVHKLKTALLERGWVEETAGGVLVSAPGELLDAWRADGDPPSGQRAGYYTVLHGGALERAVEAAVREAAPNAVLAGRSAALWLAPWLMSGPAEIYASLDAGEALVEKLKLTRAPKGPNIWLTTLEEDGPLRDADEVALGLRATSPVQTYLDLSRGGERDREAADRLRAERLPW